MILVTELIAFGLIGGLIRGAVGVYKNIYVKKESISLSSLVFILIVASVTGGLVAVITGGTWQIALLAGYAGSDFLEGMYKTMLFKNFKKA